MGDNQDAIDPAIGIFKAIVTRCICKKPRLLWEEYMLQPDSLRFCALDDFLV